MIVSNFCIGARVFEKRTRYTGYTLQITNLEAVDLEFLFEVFVTPVAAEQPVFVPSHVPMSDVEFNRVKNSVRSNPGPLHFSIAKNVVHGQVRVPIPAQSSRRVWLDNAGAWEWHSAAGYVGLRLPAGRSRDRYKLDVQIDQPARVLLHANHESYRPGRRLNISDFHGVVHYYSAMGDDYSAENVTIASGRAENEIPPEGWMFEGAAEFLKALKDGKLQMRDQRGAQDLPDDERPAALLDLLLGFGTNREQVDLINELLTRYKAPVRLKRP